MKTIEETFKAEKELLEELGKLMKLKKNLIRCPMKLW